MLKAVKFYEKPSTMVVEGVTVAKLDKNGNPIIRYGYRVDGPAEELQAFVASFGEDNSYASIDPETGKCAYFTQFLHPDGSLTYKVKENGSVSVTIGAEVTKLHQLVKAEFGQAGMAVLMQERIAELRKEIAKTHPSSVKSDAPAGNPTDLNI